jgi:hypothetical protein
MPEAQSSFLRHDVPSAPAAPACAGVLGVVGGDAGSVGVAASPGDGSAAGGGGGALTLVVERGPHAIRNTAISDSRILMRASYTSRHGK